MNPMALFFYSLLVICFKVNANDPKCEKRKKIPGKPLSPHTMTDMG